MLTVAFAGTFAAGLAPPVRAHLGIPCDIRVTDEAGIVDKLGDVEVLVAMAFTREMAAGARRLKLVQVPGAGLERIDRAALRRGVWESQWAVGAPPPPPWPELAGKTLGILGYGRIGQALAQRARAFDMEICAIRRDVARSARDGLARLGGLDILDEVLRRSDYLAITLPATVATRGLLGTAQLALMKPTAVLVNVARAEIVDEQALYRALAERAIAAAALDVWYRYPTDATPTPPARQPFHELPNVLMTPHVSGWTEGMLAARARLIADNIRRISRGEPPENLIGE